MRRPVYPGEEVQALLDRRERLERHAAARRRMAGRPVPAPPAAEASSRRKVGARAVTPPAAAYRFWVMGERGWTSSAARR